MSLKLNKPLDDYIRDSQLVEPDFGGDYVGIVVNNNDSEKLGRCRIRVYGLFDEVDEKDLPWAVPEFGFVGSKVGSFIVPPVGCVLRVRFENGDVYKPMYSTKVVDKNNLPKSRMVSYPDTMVMFETDKGSSFTIDRKTDECVFEHFSGTKFTIDTIGNVTVDPVGLYTHKGSSVVPNTIGPFNCVPVCPFTKNPHAGQISNPMPI